MLSKSITLPTDKKLIVAFSGGADSLALLALSSKSGNEVTAVYINHNIRPFSELTEEIELNRRNAKKLNVPLIVFTLKPGEIKTLAKEKKIGIEAAARHLRYRILEEYRKKINADYILTAHHREDQVETVLMRIMDSSPFSSYGGISEKNGNILRPMLNWSKDEILSYLEDNNFEFSFDSTNNDIAFRRNYIRRNIIPLLSENEKEMILRIASKVSHFRVKSENIIEYYPLYSILDRKKYLSLYPWQKEETLFSFLGREERISRKFLDNLDRKITLGSGRISYENSWFYIREDAIKKVEKIEEYNILLTTLPLKISNCLVFDEKYVNEKTLMIDFSLLKNPSVLRTSREGDEIRLKEGRKKISDLEKEVRVPYSFVLEDRNGIVAFFSSFLGGKDRLSFPFLGHDGIYVSLLCQNETIS